MRNSMTCPAFARFALAPFAALLLVIGALSPARAQAVDIQEVVSDGGITAWLVEDYTVPIVALRFAFRGGSVQDPEGMEGAANLMTGLFDEGAGDLVSDEFQEQLDEVGADMSFSAARDAIYGRMRMLAEEREGALGLLRLAITEPRFDEGPVERIRAQIVTGILADERDPQNQGREKFARAIYGDHPYATPGEGTVESLQSVTPEDLHALHGRLFARSNLSIAVVGAIDAQTLKKELDRVFGGLPAEAELREIPDATLELDQKVTFEYELPQASMQLVYPGIKREDPQFFAAYLMNHVLGGGVFSSRLFDEIREKRGLAYGVGSALHNSDYSQSLVIGTSTRADRAEEALAVIREEVAKMAESGPTAEELASAKTYVIGAYAINNLDSSSAIAGTLVELQKDDLGIDYIDRRDRMINSVTLDEAKAVAERLLSAEPAVLIIGPEADEEAE